MLRQIRQLSFVALALLVAGCKKEPGTEPAARAPHAALPSATVDALQKPYSVKAEIAGPVANGGTGTLVTQVNVTGGFHVNDQYPLSFKPEGSSEGIAFDKAKFELKDGAEKKPCAGSASDSCELRASVPFSAKAAGPARVAGVLAFSVCNPDKCLIEKVPVSAELKVD